MWSILYLVLIDHEDYTSNLNEQTLSICQILILLISGPAIDPQPASDDLLQNLANFAGISTKIADTKDLAVLAFLYLYGSIATLNGYKHIF